MEKLLAYFVAFFSLGPTFRDNKGNLLNLLYLQLEQTFDDWFWY